MQLARRARMPLRSVCFAAVAFMVAAAAADARQLLKAEVVSAVDYPPIDGYLATLIRADDGNFYGTTVDTHYGQPGGLFRLREDGLFSLLYRFTGGLDGHHASGRLLQATDGRLYGMTSSGGRHGRGTIFRIALDGGLTTLHHFSGPDGAQPSGELIQSVDGDLYGVTNGGGASGNGTAFRLGLDGSLRTIRHFMKGPNREPDAPVLGLVEYAGSFYGIFRGEDLERTRLPYVTRRRNGGRGL